MIRLRSAGLLLSGFAAHGVFSMLFVGCGRSGGSGTPPPAGDFTISTSPTSVTLENGQTQTVTVSVAPVNAFTSSVSITISGLPTGVAAAPATFSLAPGGQQKVTLTAAATVRAGTASVTFQGASGSLNHGSQVSLTLSYVPPDFSISVTPASLSVDTGGSQNVTVSVAESNGFSSSVSVSASGLPAGVTATPATFTIAPGGQQQVALAASATAATGPASITFSGTSGSLVHNTSTSMTVVAAVTGMHAPIRTRALRTNAFSYDVNDWQWSPPRFTAYDATHRQFFVSNPFLNEVDVFSAVDEIETARISIPGSWGLDISPFDGNLYAGTLGEDAVVQGGDIYVINTGTLAITKRYPASAIGPSGFGADNVLALPGGLFALENEVPSLAGTAGGHVAIWDPSTNTLDYGPPNAAGALSICFPAGGGQYSGPLTLSGDRTRILMAETAYCTSCHVCSYDPVARQATIISLPLSVRAIIPTPDGGRFFGISGNQIELFDAKTLQVLGQNTGPFVWDGGSPELDSGVISTDGKTVYVDDLLSGEVGAFDTTSLAQTGWVPTPSTTVAMSNITGAVDETGLIVGPISGGVGFLDAALAKPKEPTYLRFGLPEIPDIWPTLPEPATGPLSGGTLLSGMASAPIADGATLSQIYVGNTPGLQTSFQLGADQQNVASATTPPSSFAGAVDTTVTLSDGAVMTCIECFSYGPSFIELVSNSATADGGGTGLLVVYGLGGAPSGVSVTIGGQPANVLAEDGSVGPSSLIFSIPPGTAGTAADVIVTTSSGSTTAAGAFYYAAATQSFPLSDTLQQGIYDAGRDLYYFAGKTQIQVLSQTLGKWLSPIALPGVTSSTQLIAIAESPDGSKLAVTDQGGKAIYVLNPDNPAPAARFSLLPLASGGTQFSGLAITNSGMVYFTNESPAYPFLKLNTSSAQVTTIGKAWGGINPCLSCRVVQSSDGSHIYGNDTGLGFSFWVDPSNDQVTLSSTSWGMSGEISDLAVSGDGGTVVVHGRFGDSSMNFESIIANTDWEWLYPSVANGNAPWATTTLSGMKLNRDGSILFMPLNNGIDLYARNTGRLLYRVQIPVALVPVFDPLVAGKGTNVLAVITTNGVSILDMSSLPVGTEYTQPFPN